MIREYMVDIAGTIFDVDVSFDYTHADSSVGMSESVHISGVFIKRTPECMAKLAESMLEALREEIEENKTERAVENTYGGMNAGIEM